MVLLNNSNCFSFLFLFKIGKKQQFGDVLDRKQSYIDQKNDIYKKWKNLHSSRGVSPWFWSKI